MQMQHQKVHMYVYNELDKESRSVSRFLKRYCPEVEQYPDPGSSLKPELWLVKGGVIYGAKAIRAFLEKERDHPLVG